MFIFIIYQKATGVNMVIPMPGHVVSESDKEKVESDVKKLTTLITSHDVTILLMDSRESRWLPTLLAAAHNKVNSNIRVAGSLYR